MIFLGKLTYSEFSVTCSKSFVNDADKTIFISYSLPNFKSLLNNFSKDSYYAIYENNILYLKKFSPFVSFSSEAFGVS